MAHALLWTGFLCLSTTGRQQCLHGGRPGLRHGKDKLGLLGPGNHFPGDPKDGLLYLCWQDVAVMAL